MNTAGEIDAARRVIDGPGGEANIRQRIGQLLTALGYDEYRLEHNTTNGRADLYLPRQRTIIETKDRGGVRKPRVRPPGEDESPYEQLCRYMRGEIDYIFGTQIAAESDQPWTGILTDGRVWHRWTYEHRKDTVAQPEEQDFQPRNAGNLITWLRDVLGDKPIGKQWIPRDPVDLENLFREHHDRLRGIHDDLEGRARLETDTKIALWADRLRSAGMKPATQAQRHRLFVAHSFLIALVRGVIWTIGAHERASQEINPVAILADGFVSWITQTTTGCQWARTMLGEVCGYEWRMQRGDVLRPLYEKFVDAEDRRDFGEVYTPDWLAGYLAREVLDDDWCHRAITASRIAGASNRPVEGVGVLDPCCGSGTFLYHAARRIVEHPALDQDPPGDQATIVARLVVGMDIHPVACEFARATILRALPCEPAAGQASLRVWNGDSLLLRGETNTLFAPQNGEIVFRAPGSPTGSEVRLPAIFVAQPQFGRSIERMVRAATDKVAVPEDLLAALTDAKDKEMLEDAHAVLTDIIERKGNSVWAWFITQTVGPHELARLRVDRIMSNPPWVRMSTIQHEPRKRRLEAFATDMALWQGGIQAPHFDIAQLFIKRSRAMYLQSPETDAAAWVVKHAAIRSGNWEKFRSWRQGGVTKGEDQGHDLASTGRILDLEALQVFGGGDAQKCCVLVDNRQPVKGIEGLVVVAKCNNDLARLRGATLAEAEAMIRWEVQPAPIPQSPSDYEDMFRQGATIVPHVLAVARSAVGTAALRRVTTRRSMQRPWKEVDQQTIRVPQDWLLPHLRSNHLLPFAVAPGAPDQAIVPVDLDGELLDDERATREAGWQRLDRIYREHRSRGGNTPATLLARINYNDNLTQQLPLRETEAKASMTRLIYPKSADVMRGCRIQPSTVVVGDTLYNCVFASADEAAYLVALINAAALREAFKQSRSSGRDFHLWPWRRVPIPRYDSENPLHRELVNLCTEAELAVRDYLDQNAKGLPNKQVGRSNQIRSHLDEIGLSDRLNEAASRLLPDQCR